MTVAQAITPLDRTGTQTSEGELARHFYHYMFMMREIEDRIERKLYRQGKILGGVYVGRGQEAIGEEQRGRREQDGQQRDHEDPAPAAARGRRVVAGDGSPKGVTCGPPRHPRARTRARTRSMRR